MFETTGMINPSKANIRAGIAACWVGNASLLAVQTAILAACKRAATRAEALFSTGTGTEQTPGTLVYEGSVSINDVGQALNLI
jgi:hypothetical protein